MMKAIVVNKFGGPEVMELSDFKEPVAKHNQILVNTRMIGVNYADTYQTENSYLVQSLPPVIPGIEASFEIDGKIFVGHTASGSYAEKAIVNLDRVFEVPEGVSEEEALSVVCQGTTAYGILKYFCDVKPGDLVLINGASSAVGMILVQMCKIYGATVIAVTGSQKKIDFVKNLGADFVCLDNMSEVRKVISEAGSKPKFIIESYGGKHFMSYYSVLSTGGQICSYGASSRDGLPHIEIRDILKDSKIVSGFWGTKIFEDNVKLNTAVAELFDLIKNKKIKIVVGEVINLEDAKSMHEKIRNRETFGKLILINNFNDEVKNVI
jgi:NADPH2:quinone reductase